MTSFHWSAVVILQSFARKCTPILMANIFHNYVEALRLQHLLPLASIPNRSTTDALFFTLTRWILVLAVYEISDSEYLMYFRSSFFAVAYIVFFPSFPFMDLTNPMHLTPLQLKSSMYLPCHICVRLCVCVAVRMDCARLKFQSFQLNVNVGDGFSSFWI